MWWLPLLLASGCGSIAPLDQHLTRPAGAEVLTARGRTLSAGLLVDESFAIGPHRIEQVDRREPAWSGVGRPPAVSVRRYTFTMTDTGGALDGECKLWGYRRAPERRRIHCTCHRDAVVAARMTVEAKTYDAPLTGTATVAGDVWPVRSFGGPHLWRGHLRDGFALGEPLALAVGLDEPGEVWVAPGLSPEARPGGICLTSALMLYRRVFGDYAWEEDPPRRD